MFTPAQMRATITFTKPIISITRVRRAKHVRCSRGPYRCARRTKTDRRSVKFYCNTDRRQNPSQTRHKHGEMRMGGGVPKGLSYLRRVVVVTYIARLVVLVVARRVRRVLRRRGVVRRREVHGREVGQRAARHGQLAAQRAAQPAAALPVRVHAVETVIRARQKTYIITSHSVIIQFLITTTTEIRPLESR